MVKPITSKDAKVGSIFCVLELEEVRKPTSALNVIVTVPGREGTMERRWLMPHGWLDGHTEKDILAWVELAVGGALMRWFGTEGVLPME